MSNALFALNVSVVISNDEGFLLIKRAEDEDVFPGYWGIPGGEVEANDASLEEALKRECLEEIEVTIDNLSLISNNIVERNGKLVLYVVYKAKLGADSKTPKAMDGTDLVEWKSLAQSKELKLTPKTLDMLELAGKQ